MTHGITAQFSLYLPVCVPMPQAFHYPRYDPHRAFSAFANAAFLPPPSSSPLRFPFEIASPPRILELPRLTSACVDLPSSLQDNLHHIPLDFAFHHGYSNVEGSGTRNDVTVSHEDDRKTRLLSQGPLAARRHVHSSEQRVGLSSLSQPTTIYLFLQLLPLIPNSRPSVKVSVTLRLSSPTDRPFPLP